VTQLHLIYITVSYCVVDAVTIDRRSIRLQQRMSILSTRHRACELHFSTPLVIFRYV